MLDLAFQLLNVHVLLVIVVSLSVTATTVALVMPIFESDKLNSRMKSVSTERDRLRAARLAELNQQNPASLRQKQNGFMTQVVQQFNLRSLLETETTRKRLSMAGLRSQAPVVAFLFFRITMPIVCFIGALFYFFLINDHKFPMTIRLLLSLGIGYGGFYLPNLFVTNMIQKRQVVIKRAFPDALDLLLICVQSGMSSEAAFAKVSKEISIQSLELAEELTLTTAELSFLQDRHQAYDNLATRTGLASVKAVATGLTQAEKYGTPLSQTLRVLAQEMRDQRMAEAEKKAAALPPKLTVPMILFFLPVLFIVILGPSVIKVLAL